MKELEFSQDIKEVEIFARGTWNGFKFIDKDLDEIAKNSNELLNKEQHKPPIKLGHSKKQILDQSDGQPALGWITNFKSKAGKLFADIQDVPDILMKAFEQRIYKQLSVELAHSQHFGWFVKGLAVLGADLPAVKTLKDLDVYLSDTSEHSTTPFSLQFSAPTILNKENMTTDFETSLKADLLRKDLEFKEKERDLLDKLEKAEERNLEFAEKEKELLFSSEKEKTLSKFDKLVKDGVLSPANFSKIAAQVSLCKANFSEGMNFSISTDILHEILEKGEVVLDKSEATQEVAEETSARVDFAVEEKVRKVMHDHGIDYLAAADIVFSSNAELLDEYITNNIT